MHYEVEIKDRYYVKWSCYLEGLRILSLLKMKFFLFDFVFPHI